MAGVPPYERPVNMMFQSYALFPHHDGRATTSPSACSATAWPRPTIAARVAEMLTLVQARGARRRASPTSCPAASGSAWRWPARWPSGRSCCCSTSRSAALDKKLREETQFELMKLQQQARHHLHRRHPRPGRGDDDGRPASRVMDARPDRAGRRRPRDIYELPASRFVADFIGDVNMFEGAGRATEAGRRAIAAREPARIYVAEPRDACSRQAVVSVAIRPEKITLSRDAPAADAPAPTLQLRWRASSATSPISAT